MDHQEDEPSFDPRRWSKSAPVAHTTSTPSPRSATTEADALSFDPRSWARTATPASRPVPSPSAPFSPILPPRVTPASVAASPAFGIDRSDTASVRLVPIAVSVAILLIGAGLAWSSRPSTAMIATPAARVATVPRVVGTSRRTLLLSSTGEVRATLLGSGASPDQAEAAARAVATALGDTAGNVRLVFDVGGEPGQASLSFVEVTRDDGSGIALTRGRDGRFAARATIAHLTTRLEIVRGELGVESFYNSAVSAGVNDRLIGDFANAFAFDFDMQREVGPGDVFEAGFEQRYNSSGEAVGAPVLVYASLTTAAKSRALYRFAAPGDGQAGWFDSNGRSTRRALMRTPVDSARITSRFGPRLHPILGFVKLHNGTDFAAPTGTPIYAAGDAVVDFSGPKGANGNFVRLRHDNGWMTLYLHMNRIWPGIVAGARVAQGQQIGEIGTTGRSTGPHLHYEVHIDGGPVDPMGIDTGTGRSLDSAALVAFRRQRDQVDARRAKGIDG